MGFGISSPGPRIATANADSTNRGHRSLAEFRELARSVVRQGLIDIMLMSASTSELLALDERMFDNSPVTPAVRANDTSDIWCGKTAHYHEQPSLPFRTASLDHIQCGHMNCTEEERGRGPNLGLYSLTFNGIAEQDRAALEAYREFRIEAESKRFRHFLEVFAPNSGKPPQNIGAFVNDCIVRALAGVTRCGRPLFLKIPYFGPAALEDLVHYDPTLIVGILGGSAGTTFDAFQLLYEAKKYGARAALFGRKINLAEDQLLFIEHLRGIANGDLEPIEAVCSYHASIVKKGLRPHRDLNADLVRTES